jgi:glyoxylase-like metal-dependent hydrolase (beta-lactamase superfamily II)
MKNKILVIALAAIVGTAAAAAAVWTGMQSLDITEVKDGLYMITGNGGNIGVRVTSEGVIVIDDKFEQNYDEIIANIASVTNQPVKYVLNTHHHGDHAGSNLQFAAIAQVIAHTNVRTNMIRGNQAGPPSIVFTDQTAVFLGDTEVRAHYVGRGHTDGDAVIYFPDLRTIHTGDLIVGGTLFIDYGNGGTSIEWLDTIDNILELDFDTVIPGHGGLMTKDDVREFRTKIETLQQRGRELISQGVSKDQFGSRLNADDIGWQIEGSLFGRASLAGFYDELREN